MELAAQPPARGPSDDATAPLVSVCVAVFNAAPFVAEALQSILTQTYRNLEICVVDDGSTDGSYEIAAAVSDPRVRAIRADRNRGGYAAMNFAAAQAHGEFVAFYHADDVYDPTIVEKEVAYLRDHPDVAGVFTRDHNIDASGRVLSTVEWPRNLPRDVPLDLPTVLRYVVRHRNPFCCPSFMTRRAVFERVGRFDHARWDIAADLDLWLRLAERAPLAILDEPLVRYRKGRHQWTARYRKLRTDPDLFFGIVDDALRRHAEVPLTAADRIEFAFQRCDDNTFRAANFIISGELERAAAVLREVPFPWRTLLVPPLRRKLRLLALRALLAMSLALGAPAACVAVIRRIGP